MAGEDCAGAVELFGEDQAGEDMREGEGAQGEKEPSTGERSGSPAAGGAYREDDVLDALVAARADPCGEGFGGHGATAAIEQDGDSGGTSPLPIEPCEEGVFCFECLLLECLVLGAQHIGAPLKVEDGEGLEGIVRCEAGANVDQGDLHGEEDNAGLTKKSN